MNPLLQWILRHERGQWSAPATRQRYEQLFGPLSGAAAPTPAQVREGDRLWRSSLGQAFHLDRVRNALLGVGDLQSVSVPLMGLLAGRRGAIRIPVLARGIGPNAVTFATPILVDIPAGATGAEMRQRIADAVAAEPLYRGRPYTHSVLMFGAHAI